jgi:DNA replication protein DnaC
MLDEQIGADCKKMRLTSNIAAMAQSITADTHQEFLLQLLTQEAEFREHSRRERYVKEAGFYGVKTMDGFVTDGITFPAGVTSESLLTCDFVRTRTNIVMYGGIGTGKTHLSTAIGIAACNAGFRVKFFKTASLVNALSEAKEAGSLSAYRKRIESADLLILDEFGYVPYDRNGSRLLFEIISDCYERKSVILNTNHEFSEWANILLDEQMAVAMIDRLLHHCHLLVFSGPGGRLRFSSIPDMYKNAGAVKEVSAS